MDPLRDIVGKLSAKTSSQVAAEYAAADNPHDWYVDEVTDFMFGDSDDRNERAEEFFENLEEERELVDARQLDDEDLIQCSVRISKPDIEDGGTRHLVASFSTMPSPALLLAMLLRYSDVGDRLMVGHLYASGVGCEFEGVWPVGMDWAEHATSPMATALENDIAEEEASRYERMTNRVIAGIGTIAALGAVAATIFGRRRRR